MPQRYRICRSEAELILMSVCCRRFSAFLIAFSISAVALFVAAVLRPLFDFEAAIYPVGAPERFTARIGRFLQSDDNPELALIGSSQVISFCLCCDWFYENVKVPFDSYESFLRFQSDYGVSKHLVSELYRRGRQFSGSVLLGLPGGSVMEYRYLLDRMFAVGKRPKLLIVGVAARDFAEKSSFEQSKNCQILRQYETFAEKNTWPKVRRRVKESLRRLCRSNGYSRCRSGAAAFLVPVQLVELRKSLQCFFQQHAFAQITKVLLALTSDSRMEMPMEKSIIENVLMRRNILNDLPYFKVFYNTLNQPSIAKNLEDLRYCIELAKRNNADVIVVDMPLSRVNLGFLNRDVSDFYRSHLKKLCVQEQVVLIQSDSGSHYGLDCFFDSCHLNAKGGHRLLEEIAERLSRSKQSRSLLSISRDIN